MRRSFITRDEWEARNEDLPRKRGAALPPRSIKTDRTNPATEQALKDIATFDVSRIVWVPVSCFSGLDGHKV